MNILIERFISNLTKEKVLEFANSKDVHLNDDELDFTYTFIKKNYKTILTNPSLLNMDLYKNKYSEENFTKINRIINEYYTKYHNVIKNIYK